MQVRPGIELANLTDVGCQREKNEDYYCYVEPESEEQFCKKGRLAVVADGMGGYEGGEVASRLAVDAVREAYLDAAAEDLQTALLAGFQKAHELILQCARERPELDGMGTTCTAAALNDGHLYFAHVGDTRLYLVRNGKISQLTRDHSYVNRMIEAGLLTREQAAQHPQRSVLTAALGGHGEISADCPEAPVPLQPGDVLLMCTDGLWGLVTDEELQKVISANSPTPACNELIRRAKELGGPDNITVQILRVDSPDTRLKPTKTTRSRAKDRQA